jgi:hypothetical protein
MDGRSSFPRAACASRAAAFLAFRELASSFQGEPRGVQGGAGEPSDHRQRLQWSSACFEQ